jgi:hypothetical protein
MSSYVALEGPGYEEASHLESHASFALYTRLTFTLKT